MRLPPLPNALKTEILCHRVLHADETMVVVLKPAEGTTPRCLHLGLWARGVENIKAVIYDF